MALVIMQPNLCDEGQLGAQCKRLRLHLHDGEIWVSRDLLCLRRAVHCAAYHNLWPTPWCCRMCFMCNVKLIQVRQTLLWSVAQ